MKKLFIGFVLVLSVLAVQAQTTKTAPNSADNNKDNSASKDTKTGDDDESLAKDYLSQIMGVAMSATSNMKLFNFVYDWIGTPYHFGGSSKKGTDCSGFTKQLYSQVFNMDIERSSRDIFSMVTPIRKEDLQPGDLVFFKIHSRRISHVGIYLGNNRFAHASSRGVAISSLDDDYYRRYFYRGGRMLESFKEELQKQDNSGSN